MSFSLFSCLPHELQRLIIFDFGIDNPIILLKRRLVCKTWKQWIEQSKSRVFSSEEDDSYEISHLIMLAKIFCLIKAQNNPTNLFDDFLRVHKTKPLFVNKLESKMIRSINVETETSIIIKHCNPMEKIEGYSFDGTECLFRLSHNNDVHFHWNKTIQSFVFYNTDRFGLCPIYTRHYKSRTDSQIESQWFLYIWNKNTGLIHYFNLLRKLLQFIDQKDTVNVVDWEFASFPISQRWFWIVSKKKDSFTVFIFNIDSILDSNLKNIDIVTKYDSKVPFTECYSLHLETDYFCVNMKSGECAIIDLLIKKQTTIRFSSEVGTKRTFFGVIKQPQVEREFPVIGYQFADSDNRKTILSYWNPFCGTNTYNLELDVDSRNILNVKSVSSKSCFYCLPDFVLLTSGLQENSLDTRATFDINTGKVILTKVPYSDFTRRSHCSKNLFKLHLLQRIQTYLSLFSTLKCLFDVSDKGIYIQKTQMIEHERFQYVYFINFNDVNV